MSLLVLIGKNLQRETTLVKELKKREGYHPVVTCTTRPMRPGEVNGITYNFMSDLGFQLFKENDRFIECTSYRTANGDVWQYGTLKSSLDAKKPVIILNPEGVRSFQKAGIRMNIVYIKCSETTLCNRLKERGNDEGEAERRMNADNEDFRDIEEEFNPMVLDGDKMTPEQMVKKITSMLMDMDCSSQIVEDIKYMMFDDRNVNFSQRLVFDAWVGDEQFIIRDENGVSYLVSVEQQ